MIRQRATIKTIKPEGYEGSSGLLRMAYHRRSLPAEEPPSFGTPLRPNSILSEFR